MNSDNERRINQSGILDLYKFREATFESFDHTQPGVDLAYAKSVEFANDPQGWLVLIGTYGTGKTHLAVSIAKKRLDAGDTVIIVSAPDLLASFETDREIAMNEFDLNEAEQEFRKIKNIGLLIIDDLGDWYVKDWAKRRLDQLLNYRYNRELPTVVMISDLRGIDERIYSRLHDEELVTMIYMNASDYRLKDTDLSKAAEIYRGMKQDFREEDR